MNYCSFVVFCEGEFMFFKNLKKILFVFVIFFLSANLFAQDLVKTNKVFVSIKKKPNQDTRKNRGLFTFKSKGKFAFYQCKFDNEKWKICPNPKYFNGLKEGKHSFFVRALDKKKNVVSNVAIFEWTIDKTPPKTELVFFPEKYSNNQNAEFAFKSSEKDVFFKCKVDFQKWKICKEKIALTLKDGRHIFKVKAEDKAGNIERKPIKYVWFIDSKAPSVKFEKKNSILTNKSFKKFWFFANEKAVFECKLDDKEWQKCKNSIKITELTDGKHRFFVRATDKAKNVSKIAELNFEVDTTPPKIEFETKPAALTNKKRAEFSLKTSEKCFFTSQIDKGFKRKGKKITLNKVIDGKHLFTSFCVDRAGNRSNVLKFVWKVDTVFPKTTLLRFPKKLTSSTNARFSFKSSEKSSFLCKIDDNEWEECNKIFKISSLSDGKHKFFVKAKDLAGNIEKYPVKFEWLVDSIPPSTTILKKPKKITNDKNVKILFKTSEKIKYSLCKLDKGKWRKCFSPFILKNLKASVHDIFIKSVDLANNFEKKPQIVHWKIDVTSPKTSIKTVLPKITSKTFGEIVFKANEKVEYFKCDLDRKGWKKCFSPFKFTHLGNGNHSFKVKAVDKALNVELQPKEIKWSVDTIPPNTKLEFLANRLTNKSFVSLKLSSNENNVSFEYNLDNQKWKKCSAFLKIKGLKTGKHKVFVRAIDKAGNIDKTPEKISFRVDLIAPKTSFIKTPPKRTSLRKAHFLFSANEESKFEYSLDKLPWKRCKNDITLTKLAQRTHTIFIRATDKAGNVEKKPKKYVWTVDTTPPVAKIISFPKSNTNKTKVEFEFESSEKNSTFKYSLNNGKWKKSTKKLTLSKLRQGNYSLRVKAIDDVGNVEKDYQKYSWKIDLTPPKVSLISFPKKLTNKRTAIFEMKSNEPFDYFLCSLDKSDFKKCSQTKIFKNLSEGEHIFSVKAVDKAGNISKKQYIFKWKTDYNAPKIKIEANIKSLTNKTDVDFKISSNEKLKEILCKIDNENFEKCSKNKEFKSLSEGTHNFFVKAIDEAENQTKKPIIFSWRIDITPPETKLLKFPKRFSNSSKAIFVASNSDHTILFECKIDGSKWSKCKNKTDYSQLGEGEHSFFVRAVDKAGNFDKTPVIFNWEIDLTPPKTKIVSTPPKKNIETNATFLFETSEKETTSFCKIDNQKWKKCLSPFKIEGLSEGIHNFYIRSVDKSGNKEKNFKKYQWMIPFQFIFVANGKSHTCALGKSRTLYCWGTNEIGELGIGKSDDKFMPVKVNNMKWLSVSLGEHHTCGITTKHKLYCWGSNGSGQLGIGNKDFSYKPVQVKKVYGRWQKVSCGASFTCGIRQEKGINKLYCWGANQTNQLGDNSKKNKKYPTLVTKMPNWIDISAGYSHACGIRKVGEKTKLYCWGFNGDGEIGTGKKSNKFLGFTEPKGNFEDWKSVSAGYYHTCAIRDNNGKNTLYCWGYNGTGQLGNGNNNSVYYPSTVAFQNDGWQQIASGVDYSCGILKNNESSKLYCWGYNYYGQLGNGNDAKSLKPIEVFGDFKDWIWVSTKKQHTCGIRKHNNRFQLYCWGKGLFGELGLDQTIQSFMPKTVSGAKFSNK